ncbi:MAG: amidophosphoribosyltransferase, partial [Proteobacteria bacterium]|nr:amidophosphoribosyltransferase [Pseudomonadota bacterium]
MGGLFGTVSKKDCAMDLFYGTDYHSHLGTKRGGMAVCNSEGYERAIHNIENNYFRSKFEPDLPKLHGKKGIGIISDYDAQPLIVGSHLGPFAIVTVGKINNIDELAKRAFEKKMHFSEMSRGKINPTELVAMLISEEGSFEDGIHNTQELIKGSCSILLLAEDGIYAARDRLGRTPIIIGKKEGAYAATSETCALPNLGFEVDKYLGPGEIVFMTEDGYEQRRKPGDKMQICAF